MSRRLRSVPWWLLVPIVAIITFALVWPRISEFSGAAQNLRARQLPPLGFGGDIDHPFGTDKLGRDLAVRIAIGARSSLVVSAIAASGAAVIGTLLGMTAGLSRGVVDRALTVLTETMMAIPFLTFGLLVAVTIGQSTATLVGLLILTGWIAHARVIRLRTRSELTSGYVDAALSMGASRGHIARRHVLPNVFSTAIVLMFQQMGSMVLWSATLTYLGIGQPINTVSLGGIVNEGQELLYSAWWVSAISGVIVMLTVIGCNLSADVLRSLLDPREGHTL